MIIKTEDKKQLKILGILVIVLALVSAINVFIPIPSQLEYLQKELPASKPILALANFGIILIIYGLLSLFGYKLSRKLDWPGIFSEKASKKELFLKPLYIGLFLGFVVIVDNKIFSQFHSLGELPHPDFPFSILASLGAGIGEEIIFKLFLLSIFHWQNVLFGFGGFTALIQVYKSCIEKSRCCFPFINCLQQKGFCVLFGIFYKGWVLSGW